jgi:hypothetical protein
MHKKSCSSLSIVPPNEADCRKISSTESSEEDGDPDLDTPYKYIAISPCRDNPTEIEFWNTTRGFDQDTELDKLFNLPSLSDIDIDPKDSEDISILKSRYDWPSGPGTCIAPGHSADFNGYNLYAYFDDNCKTLKKLGENTSGRTE